MVPGTGPSPTWRRRTGLPGQPSSLYHIAATVRKSWVSWQCKGGLRRRSILPGALTHTMAAAGRSRLGLCAGLGYNQPVKQEILTDLSATSLIAAIEENGLALSRAFGRSPLVDLHEDNGLIWFETGVPFATFNGVVRTRLSPEQAAGRVGRLVEYFRSQSLPMHWMVSESSQPANLEDLLEGQGLCLASRQAAMAADLDAIDDEQPDSPGLEIRAVEDGAGLEAWHQVFVGGFELPRFVAQAFADLYRWCLGQPLPLYHYVAWLEGEPVACSSLFLAGGVAGLHNVVTLPRARRRGIGTAITLAPLLRARDMGYRASVLSSSQRGYDLYRRLGFEEYFQESTYFWNGTRLGL